MEEVSLKTVSLNILVHDVINLLHIYIYIYIYIYTYRRLTSKRFKEKYFFHFYDYPIYIGHNLLKIKDKVKWMVKFVKT